MAGEDSESRRLEDAAYATGMEGYAGATEGPRIWLALSRRNLEEVQQLIEGLDPEALKPSMGEIRCALFDGLAVLRERERIEIDAPEWIGGGGYPRPFALRALGLVRGDEPLLEQATQAFEAMGLSWHAQQTRHHRTIV